MIAHIKRHGKSAASQRFDLLLERREGIGVATRDDEVGPGAGQSTAHVLAEATAGTGDQGDFACEVEGVGGHGKILGKAKTCMGLMGCQAPSLWSSLYESLNGFTGSVGCL